MCFRWMVNHRKKICLKFSAKNDIKKLMKQLFLLFILINPSLGYSQVNSVRKKLIPKAIDSIQFSIWKEQTKETSNQNDRIIYKRKIKEITLTNKDQKALLSSIQNKLSFDNTRALIQQYNLVFDLYKNGSISTKIRVSTLNGNINIDNLLNNIYFRNKCSNEFGNFLLELLNSYNFIDSFNEIDWLLSLKNK